jgi:hypothetical protein
MLENTTTLKLTEPSSSAATKHSPFQVYQYSSPWWHNSSSSSSSSSSSRFHYHRTSHFQLYHHSRFDE